MANSWNEAGTTWGTDRWGTTDAITQGWGADSYGSGSSWGDAGDEFIPLTGFTITSALGELSAFPEQGWGHSTWGSEPWGESFSPVVPLTSLSMSASVGTFAYAQSIEGWGRDEWGIGGWGTNTTTVQIDGLTMAMAQGPNAWGESAWGDNNWGGELIIKPESIIGLTGISMGASVGSTTQNFDFKFTPTGVTMGAGLGQLSINDGTDHVQGLASLVIGSAVGSLGNQQTYELTGVSMGSAVGGLTIDDTQIADLTGITMGSAIGSVTVDDMAVGLTGVTMGSAVGSTTVTDMTVGLTGIELPSNLGTVGFGTLAYKDIDITATTSYTDITHAA